MPPTPARALDKAKLWLWRNIVYPVFPYLRNGLLAIGILRHPDVGGRQPWHLGWIDPTKSIEALLSHLEGHRFHNHFVAWVDDGQVISLRRHDGFAHQYHLRIFIDGEVRGHYEKTPESNPIQHFNRRGIFEPRMEDFHAWLDGWVVQRPVDKPVIAPARSQMI